MKDEGGRMSQKSHAARAFVWLILHPSAFILHPSFLSLQSLPPRHGRRESSRFAFPA
jgi:hypothetical protein